jgi:hypothetical protein
VRRWLAGYGKIFGAAWLCSVVLAFTDPIFRENIDVVSLLFFPVGIAFVMSIFGFAAMIGFRNKASGGVRQGIVTVFCVFALFMIVQATK